MDTMPNRISPTILGARATKELLLRVERCNREAVAATGGINITEVAALLETALSDPKARRGVLLALGEFLSSAMDGNVIDVHTWTPLELFDPHRRTPGLPIKRF